MTLDNVNSMEESLVSELRRRMKGKMTPEMYEDDNVFRRFLRARNHNIDAAETMLKNHINYRTQNKVDSMLTDFKCHPFMNSEYITFDRLGKDKEGSPLTYLHFGCLETRGILKSVTKHDIMQYVTQFLEIDSATMKKQSEKTGKLVDKCVYIFNFEEFSLSTAAHKPSLETLAGLAAMYEANFPESLKTAYAINASYYFTLLWMVIKPFLSPATVKKIKIFGKTGWQEELLQTISPDVLPAFLGGDRVDPDGDPMCKSIIRFGGPVPEKFFFANQDCSKRIPGARRMILQRLTKAEVTLNVLRPGSSIEWEFVVKNRDVAFSVLYREHEGHEPRQVVPQQRVDTASTAEAGMYQCEKAGIYTIEFDNTYSWMHNKEIYYTASVVNPRKQSSSIEETRRPS